MPVILVPRRADNGRRDQLWAWVRDRWQTEHPDWKIVEGHHDEGPFNRSLAINRAAEAAGDWDEAVIADSDSFVGFDQIEAALRIARMRHRITFAYDKFCYLSRRMSNQIMDGYTGAWEPEVEWTLYGTCSSMVVVTRDLWDQVGGFDEGYIGWGFEDVGFSVACQALGGGCDRVPGPVWHLHHQPSADNRDSPTYRSNLARMKLYEQCDYDPDKVRALLSELRA